MGRTWRAVVVCSFLLVLARVGPAAAQVTPGPSKIISSSVASQSPLITFVPATGQYEVTYREPGLRRWVGAFFDQDGNRQVGPSVLIGDGGVGTPFPRDVLTYPGNAAVLNTFEVYGLDSFGNNVFVGDAAGIPYLNTGVVGNLVNYTNNGNDKFNANNCGEQEDLGPSTVDTIANRFFISYLQSQHFYSNGSCKTSGWTLMAAYHQNGQPFSFSNGPFAIENGAFATDAVFNPGTGQVWLGYVSATPGRLVATMLTQSGPAASIVVKPGGDGVVRGELKLAVHPTTNSVFAVWIETVNDLRTVKGQLYSQNGVPIGGELTLSNPATEQIFRDLVAATADNFFVVGFVQSHVVGRVVSPSGAIASEWTRLDHLKDQFNQDVNVYNGVDLVANPVRGTYAVVVDSFSDTFFIEVTATAGVPLTVTKAGNGSGTITSSPAGIDCPGACAMSQPPGTVVDLTATAGAYSDFTGWSGACAGAGACSITLDAPKTVTATFTKQRFALSLVKSGQGTVTSVPAGIDCGASCSAMFDAQAIVSLTATPDAGWRFAGWSGACTGGGTCDVEILGAASVTANFIQQFTLTVSTSGSGTGLVESATGISCPGGACSLTVDAGSSVSLTATALAGSRFAGWSGACSGAAACDVVLSGNRSVDAGFVQQVHLQAAVSGSGSISSNPAGITCPGACNQSLDLGASVSMIATPAPGWILSSWGGACSGTGACAITMSGDQSVSATFIPTPTFALSITLAGAGGGAVASSPAGILCGGNCVADFDAGTVVTLTATPNATSTFAGWSGACSGTGACVVTMSAARSVTATFDAVTIASVSGAIASLSSTIGSGPSSSVNGKLSNAQASIARGNRSAAVNQLNAAINELQALVRSGRLNPATAANLIAALRQIIAGL